MSEKIYRGRRSFAPSLEPSSAAPSLVKGGYVVVSERGGERPLDPRRDMCPASADFSWGETSSGSVQLAFAICCDCIGEEVGSDAYVYLSFEADYVSAWADEWEISAGEIHAWAACLPKGALRSQKLRAGGSV